MSDLSRTHGPRDPVASDDLRDAWQTLDELATFITERRPEWEQAAGECGLEMEGLVKRLCDLGDDLEQNVEDQADAYGAHRYGSGR